MNEAENYLRVISSVVKHEYDIDLKEIVRMAENKKEEIVYSNNHQKKALYKSYTENLHLWINNHCSNQKIDFENSVAVIVTLNSKDEFIEYGYFLAQLLLLKPVYLTESILNHHLEMNMVSDILYFITAVEHSVKNYIENEKLFDNYDLLNTILKWANVEKKNLEKGTSGSVGNIHLNTNVTIDNTSSKRKKTKPNQDLNSDLPKLVLSATKPIASKFISTIDRELKSKKHILKDGDFLKVFVNAEKIVWNGELAYLVYLLSCLYKGGYIKSSGKVGNEIWNAAGKYFEIHDITGKKFENIRFSNILYRIKISNKKYIGMLTGIDSMFKSIDENTR